MFSGRGIRVTVCMLLTACVLPVLCPAQTAEDYFILGTLDDTAGRLAIDRKQGQIDHYYPGEQNLANYICGLAMQRWDDCRLQQNDGWNLYSAKFFPVLDSLYRRGTEAIESKEQALPFAHGFYVRYGHEYLPGTLCVDAPDLERGRVFYKAALLLGLDELVIASLPGYAQTTRIIFRPGRELGALINSTRPIEPGKSK